ncbi:hypothetical protein OED52_13670 [Rhodococcus sp. Z13]|uniref:Uncharacterized protein n=1 Tax=Rhodococcus sacchari TaxID=2962047 RepID=A0ACD4DCC9_9NOCA|nr:hypothetical protein [Rhodococcus sp. Z13]UYP17720.1 hypothetical protein OED52_13670 [Rhodococcus sp. Z13]
MTALGGMSMPQSIAAHRLVEVWQERPNEVSYRCSCGLVSKHQEFGPVPQCPEEESE